MIRKHRGARIVALMTVVLGSLLAGCQSNPPVDTSKLPNKDTKAGPPTASPAELRQIQEHMKSGH